MSAVQVAAAVVANEAAGAYRRIVLAAPGAAELAMPGQFVALGVGDEPTAMLLRRCFSIHRASGGGAGVRGPLGPAQGPSGPAQGPTVEIVVAPHGPGSTWITRRRPGDVIDLVGPLGRPFAVPAAGVRVVLVGGGYGSAPLTWFAEELRRSGVEVDLLLGAATAGRLFGADEGEAAGAAVQVTTDDGSAGTHGRVTAALPRLLRRGAGEPEPVEVYACGPMAMLKAVAKLSAGHGCRTWVAVEESMACGIGVCMTCVLPVRDSSGSTRMVRSCVEGPTFDARAVRWDAVLAGPGGKGSAVPVDCLGAPRPGGHQ